MLDKLFNRPRKLANKPDSVDIEPVAENPRVPISVRSLSRHFGDFKALENISFDLAKGESLGIVGLNGAGKSTLLQIIAGTLKPSSGEVLTSGRLVAMLELGTGFNPEYTGLENIYLNASILGIPRKTIKEKLPEIEAFAEIGDFVHKPVKTYSSGMSVRLAFSMLTQVNPDIMIIDEALSVGDAYFSHKCMNLIRKFRENGKTFLVVSHSPSAIKSLCDRAILLEKGVMTKMGSPNDVLDYYNAIIANKEEEFLKVEQAESKGRTTTRSGNGKARIQSFDLMDSMSQPRRVFEIGEYLKIYCSIKANIELECPTLGFLIKDKLGNDVFGTNTHHLKFDSGTIRTGELLNLVFETQLYIGAGEYSVTLAAHEGDRHVIENYDWYDGVVIFRVIPDSSSYFTGIARLPAQVNFAPDDVKLRRHYSYGLRIDPQSEQPMSRYLVEGWSVIEVDRTWTDGATATIMLDIEPSKTDRTLRLDVTPYVDSSKPNQAIHISLFGKTLFSVKIEKRSILEIPIPKNRLENQQLLHVVINTPDAIVSKPISDPRHLGIALHFFEII